MAEDLPRLDSGELSLESALDETTLLGPALAHVPGYGPGNRHVAISHLPGGSVNRSYRVVTLAGRYVLRLSPATDAWLASDRSVERALHARAAAAGIAPRIVHADEQDRWLITEFVEGRQWSAEDFASSHSIGLLADTLRHLHELPAPTAGRFDLLSALGAYVRCIAGAEAGLDRHLAEAERAWQLSGGPDRRPAIVHHDLHASNVIEARDGPMLIDWECAAVTDPLLDVACVLSYYPGVWSLAPMFLQRVGLQDVDRTQLRYAAWLFDLHTWLWYRERRQRRAATAEELAAERCLSLRVARYPSG